MSAGGGAAATAEPAILPEAEARSLVERLGVSLPGQVVVPVSIDLHDGARKACDRLSGKRVVLKGQAPDLAHKSDVGGVEVVKRTPRALAIGMLEMGQRLAGRGLEGFTVNEFVDYDGEPGAEMLLSIRRTPDFGPVVSLGIGGVATEVLAAAMNPQERLLMAAAELTSPEALDRLLTAQRVVPLLTGEYRGRQPRIPRSQLRALIDRALEFAATMPEDLLELELNPIVVVDGTVYALDVLARRGPSPATVAPRPLDKIARLLEPRSIAVAGVSQRMNPGRIIVRNLLHWGFPTERIHVIKPGTDEIDGCACVDAIADLPASVDLLVLSIGAEQVPDAIDEVIANRAAESVIVIPGGLGEHVGSENLAAHVRASLEASRGSAWRGPVVNGGNCLGIRSCPGGYDTMFLPPYKVAPRREPDAPLAVVSQSGAFVVSKASKLARLSPRFLVSIGNQIDLTVGDYFEHLVERDDLDVFAFYIEGFQPLDGRRWLRAAQRAVAAGRTVIAYRAGRTAAGAEASASHTAAMAGDAALTMALARAEGVLVADTLADFEDLVLLACRLRDRDLHGLGLGAISNAGFEAVAVADALGPLRLAELTEQTRERMAALLQERRLERIVTIANPFDVNPMMNDAGFVAATEALLDDPAVDLGVIGCVPLTGALQTLPAGDAHREDLDSDASVVAGLCSLWDRTDKAWVAIVDAGDLYDPMARRLEEHGIPVFRTIDRAVRLLGAYAGWRRGARRER